MSIRRYLSYLIYTTAATGIDLSPMWFVNCYACSATTASVRPIILLSNSDNRTVLDSFPQFFPKEFTVPVPSLKYAPAFKPFDYKFLAPRRDWVHRYLRVRRSTVQKFTRQ